MRRLAWVALLAFAQAAAAAPVTSPPPAPRPGAAAAPPAGQSDRAALAPAPRPDAAPPTAPAGEPAPDVATAEPPDPAMLARPLDPDRAGTVCGDPAIQGERIERIPGRIEACGVTDPIRLASVAGLRLSQGAVVDCTTARALRTWIEDGVRPAIRRLGGGPVELRVAAHYACRTRNHQAGAKVSKHGLGRAIDISGIELADGQVLTVEEGWRDPAHGPRLRRMHRAACGPFSTVLGPNADRFHRDHFHFDTTRGRSRAYCR